MSSMKITGFVLLSGTMLSGFFGSAVVAADIDSGCVPAVSGVTGKLEQRLNDVGVFHFWQIADLDATGLQLLDKTLRLKGQSEKDGWIDQAKKLVAAKAA